jgi:hypothetical protein
METYSHDKILEVKIAVSMGDIFSLSSCDVHFMNAVSEERIYFIFS